MEETSARGRRTEPRWYERAVADTQRVRHFVRVFFQMRTWQDYASACFFSCLPRRRNNRDSKNNSRSPKIFESTKTRDLSFLFLFFFPRSLTIDSSKLRGKYSSIIDNNENSNEETQKNPFLVDRQRGGHAPFERGRNICQASATRSLPFSETFRLYEKKLVSSDLRFVEGPSKISLQVIRPDFGTTLIPSRRLNARTDHTIRLVPCNA